MEWPQVKSNVSYFSNEKTVKLKRERQRYLVKEMDISNKKNT